MSRGAHRTVSTSRWHVVWRGERFSTLALRRPSGLVVAKRTVSRGHKLSHHEQRSGKRRIDSDKVRLTGRGVKRWSEGRRVPKPCEGR